MSNKWETSRIKKEEFEVEWKKYLSGEYLSQYPIAEKFKVSYGTVRKIAKRFGFEAKRSCRQVDIDRFIEVYNRFACREITDYQAAKELGVCYPVFYKWIGALWTNGLRVEGLPFIYDEREWQEKKSKQQ